MAEAAPRRPPSAALPRRRPLPASPALCRTFPIVTAVCPSVREPGVLAPPQCISQPAVAMPTTDGRRRQQRSPPSSYLHIMWRRVPHEQQSLAPQIWFVWTKSCRRVAGSMVDPAGGCGAAPAATLAQAAYATNGAKFARRIQGVVVLLALPWKARRDRDRWALGLRLRRDAGGGQC